VDAQKILEGWKAGVRIHLRDGGCGYCRSYGGLRDMSCIIRQTGVYICGGDFSRCLGGDLPVLVICNWGEDVGDVHNTLVMGAK
jgi:hypothetical protein